MKFLTLLSLLGLGFSAYAANVENFLAIYFMVDARESAIDFAGANLYAVNGGTVIQVDDGLNVDQPFRYTDSGNGVVDRTLGGVIMPDGTLDASLANDHLYNSVLADVTKLGDSNTLSFYVELVNESGDVVGVWDKLCDYVSMADVKTAGALEGHVEAMGTQKPYRHSDAILFNHFSPVPEPTGGVLVLVGGALLALRRKRKPIGLS